MATHIIDGVTIHVGEALYWLHPKDRYSAVTDDYDADCDGDGYYTSHPQGHGPTEQAAIDDLLQQLADQEEG